MSENINQPAVKEQNSIILDYPKFAQSLLDVYKAGGLPLAFLFVAGLVILGLLSGGLLDQIDFISQIVTLLIGSGALTFMIYAVIGYLNYRMDVNAYLNRISMELEAQDQFIQTTLSHALNTVASKPDWAPGDVEKFLNASLSENMLKYIESLLDLRKSIPGPERGI